MPCGAIGVAACGSLSRAARDRVVRPDATRHGSLYAGVSRAIQTVLLRSELPSRHEQMAGLRRVRAINGKHGHHRKRRSEKASARKQVIVIDLTVGWSATRFLSNDSIMAAVKAKIPSPLDRVHRIYVRRAGSLQEVFRGVR